MSERDYKAEYEALLENYNSLLEEHNTQQVDDVQRDVELQTLHALLTSAYTTMRSLENPFTYLWWRVTVVPRAKKRVREILEKAQKETGIDFRIDL